MAIGDDQAQLPQDLLRRLLRAIRATWPKTEILLRADSHYACPEVLDWCEANGVDYILGLAPTNTLKRHVVSLEASTAARFKADPSAGKVRRFKEIFDAAGSWSRVRRIVARVEAGSEGTRFIVTNLDTGNGRSLYQDLYCRRGQAETTSRRGRHTSPPTAPRVRRRPPTSSGCSCTLAPTGCCGVCAR